MNFYLISYNFTQNFDPSDLHRVITTLPTVTDWWHYLPNVYIVSTQSSANVLADRIIQSFQGLLFVVVKLDLRDYNGVLNKDAWEWIRRKNNENIKLKIVQNTPNYPSPLSNLLSGYLPPISSRPVPKKPMSLDELLKLANKLKK